MMPLAMMLPPLPLLFAMLLRLRRFHITAACRFFRSSFAMPLAVCHADASFAAFHSRYLYIHTSITYFDMASALRCFSLSSR